MRTLEQHELNEVSGAGFFSDAGALIDDRLNQIGSKLSELNDALSVEAGKASDSAYSYISSIIRGFCGCK